MYINTCISTYLKRRGMFVLIILQRLLNSTVQHTLFGRNCILGQKSLHEHFCFVLLSKETLKIHTNTTCKFYIFSVTTGMTFVNAKFNHVRALYMENLNCLQHFFEVLGYCKHVSMLFKSGWGGGGVEILKVVGFSKILRGTFFFLIRGLVVGIFY